MLRKFEESFRIDKFNKLNCLLSLGRFIRYRLEKVIRDAHRIGEQQQKDGLGVANLIHTSFL